MRNLRINSGFLTILRSEFLPFPSFLHKKCKALCVLVAVCYPRDGTIAGGCSVPMIGGQHADPGRERLLLQDVTVLPGTWAPLWFGQPGAGPHTSLPNRLPAVGLHLPNQWGHGVTTGTHRPRPAAGTALSLSAAGSLFWELRVHIAAFMQIVISWYISFFFFF